MIDTPSAPAGETETLTAEGRARVCHIARECRNGRSNPDVYEWPRTVLRYEATVAALESQLTAASSKYDVLAAAINDTAFDCDPGCDSYAHTDTCSRRNDPSFILARQQAEVVELRAQLAAASSARASAERDAERYRRLRFTMESAKGGASLEVNRHLAYYEDATEGEQVEIQWYPDVGFYVVHGTTLDAAVDQLAAASPTPDVPPERPV